MKLWPRERKEKLLQLHGREIPETRKRLPKDTEIPKLEVSLKVWRAFASNRWQAWRLTAREWMTKSSWLMTVNNDWWALGKPWDPRSLQRNKSGLPTGQTKEEPGWMPVDQAPEELINVYDSSAPERLVKRNRSDALVEEKQEWIWED